MTMPRNSGAFLLTILLGAIIPATGQTPPGRIAVSPQRVASALAQAGWRVNPEQVKFLSQVTAAAGDAGLQVVQVTRWQRDKLKVELRCHDPHACLPFYVLVNEDRAADKSGQTSVADTASTGKPPAFEMTAETPLLRSGDPATLTFANKGLSINMPVICLENGHRGQKIRVASTDHRRFYKAEIVGPGLLKATTL